MSEESLTIAHDRDVIYREMFEGKQREYLKELVSDEVIEEHCRNPLGQHSEPLERLLIYFRRGAQSTRYAIKRDNSTGGLRVVTLQGGRANPIEIVEGETYASADEAYHDIFLRRVRELMES